MRSLGILVLALGLSGCATVSHSAEPSEPPSVQEVSHEITAGNHLQTGFTVRGWHTDLGIATVQTFCDGIGVPDDQPCAGNKFVTHVFQAASASRNHATQNYFVVTSEGHMPTSGEDVLMVNVVKR